MTGKEMKKKEVSGQAGEAKWLMLYLSSWRIYRP
jgi:hypothetical protein